MFDRVMRETKNVQFFLTHGVSSTLKFSGEQPSLSACYEFTVDYYSNNVYEKCRGV